jgi:hypothetical protein
VGAERLHADVRRVAAAVLARWLSAQRPHRPCGDRRRAPIPQRDRPPSRPARPSRRPLLDARSGRGGVRDRPLRRSRLGRSHDAARTHCRRAPARRLRRGPGARRAADLAVAAVRRPRTRRRVRRPLSVQRRARQLLLLHDPVPPGRQRPHAAESRPGVPARHGRCLRRRRGHLPAEPPARQRPCRGRRRGRDARRNRLGQSRRPRHRLPGRHRTAHASLWHRAGLGPQRADHRRHERRRRRGRRRRGRTKARRRRAPTTSHRT